MTTQSQIDRPSSASSDSNRPVSITLPAWTWREIEMELRTREIWWLANMLVNTGSPVFSSDRNE